MLEAIGAGLSISVGCSVLRSHGPGRDQHRRADQCDWVVVRSQRVIGGERIAAVQVSGSHAIIGIFVVSGGPRTEPSRAVAGARTGPRGCRRGGLFFWFMSLASHGGVARAMVIARRIAVLGLAAALARRRTSLRPPLSSLNAWFIPIGAVLGSAGCALYGESTRASPQSEADEEPN